MTEMTPEQIDAALEAGIISADQAKAMRARIAPKPAPGFPGDEGAVIGDEDNMRFLRSFSDIFIAIGIGIVILGLGVTGALFGGGTVYIGAALIMALMAEFFGRKKRAHLPTLLCALAFLIFTLRGVGSAISGFAWGGDILTALITLGAMLLFYLRVRLPFCIALIALAALYLGFSILSAIAPGMWSGQKGLSIFLGGLITFLAAIMYDMRDKHRTTRFSDNAFWLHFIAAPLIIHGLALQFATLKKELLFNLVPIVTLDKGDAVMILLLVLVITVIGLAINRRALIVSSLAYAAFAMGYLFKGTGMEIPTLIAVTLLLLGGAIILLGTAWHGVRNRLLTVLPKLPVFPPPFDPHFKA